MLIAFSVHRLWTVLVCKLSCIYPIIETYMLNCYQRYLFVLLTSVTLQHIFTVIFFNKKMIHFMRTRLYFISSVCLRFLSFIATVLIFICSGIFVDLCLYISSRWPPVWETAVHLAVGGGVFDGVFLCCPFSH